MKLNMLLIFKILEAIIASAILCLHFITFGANSVIHLLLVTAIFSGLLVYTIGSLVKYLRGKGYNRRWDMCICVIGALLYVTAGGMSIYHFVSEVTAGDWIIGTRERAMRRRWGLAKGSLAIIQGGILVADVLYAKKHNPPSEPQPNFTRPNQIGYC